MPTYRGSCFEEGCDWGFELALPEDDADGTAEATAVFKVHVDSVHPEGD